MNSAWLFPDWPSPPDVRAAVSTRFGPGISEPPFELFNLGTRCGDDPAAVAENRLRLRVALSLPSQPCWLRQVHGTNVAEFPLPTLAGGDDACAALQEPEADAAVAYSPGVTLAILTADCLPVLFCTEDGSGIAAAHAGWRGLSAGVLEATVAALRTSPGRILAWLGPAIGPRSYEVGAEVRDAFLARNEAAAAAFAPTRPGHWLCDLCMLARQNLRTAGVTRIFGGGFDTFADPRFYSWRRDGRRSGRFASLIWSTAGPR